MINTANSIEQLRKILIHYPEFRKEIEPLAIQKKNFLENPVVEKIKY